MSKKSDLNKMSDLATLSDAIHKHKLPRPVYPKPPENFADVLRQRFPEQMKEFDDAPWDFKIYAPCSLDDVPVIWIYLYVGKKKQEKQINLILPLG